MASQSSSFWRFWAFSPPLHNGFVLTISRAKKMEIASRNSTTSTRSGVPRSSGSYRDGDYHIPAPPPMKIENIQQKKKQKKLYQRDPFEAAMIECRKDRERKDKAKAFQFSCKNSCSTSDSHVILKSTRAVLHQSLSTTPRCKIVPTA